MPELSTLADLPLGLWLFASAAALAPQPIATPPALWWLMVVWLAMLGGCVGSFLNVVVWRMPLGKSIVHPGSFCPKCQHPIRWHDNLPIFGWLLLRGRCRDCQARISARYPLVEFFVASIFVMLAITGPLASSENLPRGSVDWQGKQAEADSQHEIIPHRLPGEQIISTEPIQAWHRWCIYAYHALLIVTLVAIWLIDLDGQRVPVKTLLLPLLVGYCAPLILLVSHVQTSINPNVGPTTIINPIAAGWLRPVSWASGIEAWPAWLTPLLDGLLGAIAGGAFAFICWPIVPFGPSPRKISRWNASAAAKLTGLYLGWQAVMFIAAWATVLFALVLLARNTKLALLNKISWIGCLLLVTLAWIPLWRAMTERFDSLDPASGIAPLVVALPIVTGTMLIAWAIAPRGVRS